MRLRWVGASSGGGENPFAQRSLRRTSLLDVSKGEEVQFQVDSLRRAAYDWLQGMRVIHFRYAPIYKRDGREPWLVQARCFDGDSELLPSADRRAPPWNTP